MTVALSHAADFAIDELKIGRILDDTNKPASTLPEPRRETHSGQTALVSLMSAKVSDASPAFVKELSAGGIAYLSRTIVLPGTRIRLTFQPPESKAHVDKRAIVRRTQCVGRRLFEIAADFLD